MSTPKIQKVAVPQIVIHRGMNWKWKSLLIASPILSVGALVKEFFFK